MDSKKILALIPARGGSKGVPDKNIKKILDKPLILHTIDFARNCQLFDDIVVSTDGSKIIDICQQYQCEIIKRPENICKDDSLVIDAIHYTILELKRLKREYDIIVLLEPTSPIRDKKNLYDGLNAIINNGYDSATTFCEVDPPPSRLWKNKTDGMTPLFSHISPFEPRQSHKPAFKLTGQFYIFKTDFIMTSKKSVISDKFYPIMVNSKYSVDIDEEIDFVIAEAILKLKQ